MPRAEPIEDATFPVYRVKATCPKCGRKGWTNSLQNYPKGTVIKTRCSKCVQSWERRVAQFHSRPLGVIRAKAAKQAEPEHNPREYKPHWTD